MRLRHCHREGLPRQIFLHNAHVREILIMLLWSKPFSPATSNICLRTVSGRMFTETSLLRLDLRPTTACRSVSTTSFMIVLILAIRVSISARAACFEESGRNRSNLVQMSIIDSKNANEHDTSYPVATCHEPSSRTFPNWECRIHRLHNSGAYL